MSNTTDLRQRITDDVKQAMRAKQKQQLGVLRLISAAIKQREIDERIELDDAQVLAVLEKMLKQRKDSIDQFKKAERDDLVQQEVYEVELIQTYLPAQLSKEEVNGMIEDAIAATGASSMKDMGKVMGALKSKLAGRADMGAVSGQIKARLTT